MYFTSAAKSLSRIRLEYFQRFTKNLASSNMCCSVTSKCSCLSIILFKIVINYKMKRKTCVKRTNYLLSRWKVCTWIHIFENPNIKDSKSDFLASKLSKQSRLRLIIKHGNFVGGGCAKDYYLNYPHIV